MTNEELAAIIQARFAKKEPHQNIWNDIYKKYPEVANYMLEMGSPVNKLRRQTSKLKLTNPQAVWGTNTINKYGDEIERIRQNALEQLVARGIYTNK